MLSPNNVVGDICDNDGYCNDNFGETTSNCPNDCPVQCTPPEQLDIWGRNYCALSCGDLAGPRPNALCASSINDCNLEYGPGNFETFLSYDCQVCCKKTLVTVNADHSPTNPVATNFVTITATTSQAVGFLDISVGRSINIEICKDSSRCEFIFRADLYGTSYNYYATARSQSGTELGRSETRTITLNQGPGGLTSTPNSVSISVGERRENLATISEGTGGPYSFGAADACDSAIAWCDLLGPNKNSLYVEGRSVGSTKITVRDSAGRTVDIPVTVTATPALCNGQPQPTTGCASPRTWQCVGNAWECRSVTPTGCPACDSQGPYYSPTQSTSTSRGAVERAMSCLEPKGSSMDCVVQITARFGTNIRRMPRFPNSQEISRNKIILPDGTGVDILRDLGDDNTLSIWRWLTESGTPTPTGPCSLGPYTNLLTGWDLAKLRDCNVQTPKYKAGRVFSFFSTPQLTDSVLSKLREASTNPTKISNDVVNFDVEYEPGKKVGKVDIIYAMGADGIGQAWQWRVADGQGTIQKCNPDEDACGYCSEETQCLVNPLATEKQCISSGEYVGDNYCENGLWSTRTKLLALRLLGLAQSEDHILFCDDKENTLNNLQYITDSGEVASSIINNLDANNFCVLKTKDKIIVATSINKDIEQVRNGFNIFGVASCSNANSDGNYYSCDTSNKVWYNKKLKSVMYSATSITLASSQTQPTSLSDIIKNIIDKIKALITKPPFDESYVKSIKRFDKLYLAKQGTKSIRGAMEGKNLKNAFIEYINFDKINICSYTDGFNKEGNFVLSGISCKKDGNNYYVLAQGSKLTSFNPENIWADLTAKLRLK